MNLSAYYAVENILACLKADDLLFKVCRFNKRTRKTVVKHCRGHLFRHPGKGKLILHAKHLDFVKQFGRLAYEMLDSIVAPRELAFTPGKELLSLHMIRAMDRFKNVKKKEHAFLMHNSDMRIEVGPTLEVIEYNGVQCTKLSETSIDSHKVENECF